MRVPRDVTIRPIPCSLPPPVSSASTSPAPGRRSTFPLTRREHRSSSRLARPDHDPVRRDRQLRRAGRRASDCPARPAPSVPPTVATRCRSSCRATGSSAATAPSSASVAGWRRRRGCCTTSARCSASSSRSDSAGQARPRAFADCSRRMRASSCSLRLRSWRRALIASRSGSSAAGASTTVGGALGRRQLDQVVVLEQVADHGRGVAPRRPASTPASAGSARAGDARRRPEGPRATGRWSGCRRDRRACSMQSASAASVRTRTMLSIVPSRRPLTAASRRWSGVISPPVSRSRASR